MAEGVAGAAGSAVIATLFKPNPSADILKFWQGIVEIALRVGSLVLLFILFICSCATLSNLNQFGARDVFEANLLRDTTAAAGWLLFVTIVAAIIEGLIIVSRFLNFGFINKFGTIVHIVDIVISFGIAAAIFCGAIAIGVYSGTWNTLGNVDPATITNIIGSTGATSAFAFFTLFLFIGLGVFMILSMVLKWRNTSKYSSPSTSGGGDEAGAE